jgi:hypothetical protein
VTYQTLYGTIEVQYLPDNLKLLRGLLLAWSNTSLTEIFSFTVSKNPITIVSKSSLVPIELEAEDLPGFRHEY